jgi:hypothetical protein
MQKNEGGGSSLMVDPSMATQCKSMEVNGINLRALEDNEQVNIAERLVPERIGPRGVREQGARTAGGIGIEKERNAVGGDVVDAADYEQAEGMRAY